MSKRKMEDVVAYVHGISPSKRNFNVKLQTSGNEKHSMVKAICFDKAKRDMLVDASVSGDPVKFKNLVKQEDRTGSYFAEYIINQKTTVEKVTAGTVSFERKEIEKSYVSVADAETKDVGDLVCMKAKINISHSIEKVITLNKTKRKARVFNNCFLYGEGGSIKFSIWDDWIPYILNQVKSCDFFEFTNLLVNQFDGEKFLTTCSDTNITVLSVEEAPQVELQTANNQIHITEIDIIHSIELGYSCRVCNKILQVTKESVLTCSNCNAVQRVSNLKKRGQILFEANQLGDKLYEMDLDQVGHIVGEISMDCDQDALKEKLMGMKDLFVTLNERDNKVTVVA